jgi:hypothetical protein
VLFARAHDAPASVTVTVVPDPDPVAVQFEKVPPSVIVGVAGTVKPGLKPIVIVLPAASAPLELVVKPTVQSERAPPVCGEPAKETAVTGLAMTTADAGFAAAVSRDVLMPNVLAAYEPLPGFVSPFTVRLTAAEFATAHEAPASVTVTTLLEAEPVAVQVVKPELRTTVGVAGIVKPELNVSVIVSPAAIAPLADVVNVSVQLAAEPPVCTEPLNVGLETGVAALIVTADAGFAGIRSLLVAMLNVFAARLPALGFVRLLTVSVALVDAATAHEAPARVSVTVVPVVEPVAVQLVKPAPSVIVGVAGIAKPPLKTIVIVPPAASAPAELVLNVSVQSARAPAVWGEPAKLTFVGAFEIRTAEPGFVATVSRLVFTLKPDAA